jgi:ATP-binding cassette subfamily B protein
LGYAAKYKGQYFIGIIFLLLVDAVQLIPPKIMGNITDSLSKGEATSTYILKNIGYIILVAIVMAIGRYAWRIFIIGTSRKIEYDIRNKYFKHLQSLSANFYNKNKTGDLMALATNDLNAVRMSLGQGIIMMTDALVLSIATITILFTINVKLTLIALIPLPFVALASSRFGKQIHSRFLKVQETFSKLTDMVQENFSGIRIIKSFVQEQKEYEKFTKENEKYFETNMAFIKLWGVFSPLIELIASLSLVLLIGVGGTFVIYGYISLGDFISFHLYLGNLIWPMMAIGWVINIIQRGFASLDRIEYIFHQKPEIFDNDVEDVKSLSGDIEIQELSFKYPDANKYSLSNISLKLKKGQTLGIIGRTGSGKSTLVNLLLRLYELPKNSIKINNHDINNIPLSVLRENIGFVPQDAFLFSTTISENVNLANEKLDMEKVVQATKDSDVYTNIVNFDAGFDTMVGERGVTLSGGQKQRISIARSIIKEPEIIIFDDCLSAVDAKTEAEILKNLKRIMEKRTSIIISHRISAIREADLIIVLDDGCIVARGTHEELIEKEGIYKEIFEKQLIEEKIALEGEV